MVQIRTIDARNNPGFIDIQGGASTGTVNYFLQGSGFDNISKALDTDGQLKDKGPWQNVFDDTIGTGIINLYVSAVRITNRVQEKLKSFTKATIKVLPEDEKIAASAKAVSPLMKWSDFQTDFKTWSDFGTAFSGAKWKEVEVE